MARCVGEAAEQRQALALLVLQDRRALVLARGAIDRLGADEGRRHHDLIAQDEVVDDDVMAVELPAPRLGGRGRAHHGDVVEPLAVVLEVVVVQLAQRVVQLHDVARELSPLALSDARSRPNAARAAPRSFPRS